MKVSCLQMKVAFCDVEENFRHAAQLIEEAMLESPDVLVLPETWNTGFFPKENLRALCDDDGSRVKREIGALARKHHVNIIAGSVSNLRSGKVYNTALVFDREGNCIASYDKTHLFTPMGEDNYHLNNAFSVTGYPTTVFIDRYGTVCLVQVGAMLRESELANAFAYFTAKDYEQVVFNSLASIPYSSKD